MLILPAMPALLALPTMLTLLTMMTQAAASGALPYANALDCVRTMVAQEGVRQRGQSAHLAAPQLGSCTSSVCAWRLWAARHSQGKRPRHRAPGQCLGCSSQPHPRPPTPPPLALQVGVFANPNPTPTPNHTGGCILRWHWAALTLHGTAVGHPARTLTLTLTRTRTRT